jgi:hypothetical protein
MWDSTGPKGGLGPKFERAMVSEIVGIDAEVGDLRRLDLHLLAPALLPCPAALLAHGQGDLVGCAALILGAA